MLANRRPRAGLALVAAAAALTGCGSGNGPASTATPSAGDGADTITIKNFKYNPNQLSVTPGQRVTVINTDDAPHTLTAQNKTIDSHVLNKGQSFTFTAGKAGTYSYLCSIHNYMTGTLTVT